MYEDKTEERFKGYYEGRKKLGLSIEHYWPKETIAFKQCYKNFGNIREKVVFKKIIEVTEKQKTSFPKNTKLKRFTCGYSLIPSEKSKIFIDGPEATEITAIGIKIKYSNVNLSDKGAFSLQGASNDPGRAWFIGSQSFLLLDTDMLPYNCN